MKYFFRTQYHAYLLRPIRTGLRIKLNIEINKTSNNQNYLSNKPLIGEPFFSKP